MADNFVANPGSGGSTFRADDVGAGLLIPFSKIDAGGDGLQVPIIAGQQTMSASLPVVFASDQTALTVGTHAVTQSGSWTLAANQSVNVAQINGVTTTMGNGVAGTGVQRVTLASDSTGQVTLAAGANTIGALTANQSVNVAQINGVATTMGNGVSGTGVQRVTLASDSTGQVAIASGTVTTVSTLTNITNWGNIVDNAAFTDGTTRVSMSGFIFDEVAGTALTENDAAAARIDSKRALVCGIEDGTTRGQRAAVDASGNLAVSNKATATGGATIQKVLSAASTNATSVKASAGNILGIALMNTNAAVRYLHLYNKASAPTVGTDVPVATFAIPGNAAGAGFTLPCDIGAAFATGIAYALTTGAADTDTGAVALNEITGWILYK